jgi:endonuclease YncB( thermonuclease family)
MTDKPRPGEDADRAAGDYKAMRPLVDRAGRWKW